ncbi:MAG: hypothetical protein GY943_35295, partial [Chloroflexi bacterium]|nr:hypothetical protein [Chloroflexota bacterium]
ILSPVEATKDWVQGKGFDLKRGYNTLQQSFDARKQQTREKHPKSSLAGEILGGVATGGQIAKNVGTMVGKGLLPTMFEGGLYGGTYSAGEAKHGEKLKEGAKGFATGAVTAGVLNKVGSGISNQIAKRAGNKLRQQIPVMSSDELGDSATQLYSQMRASGAVLPKAAGTKAKFNIDVLLKQTNEDLAPQAFGLKKVIENTLKKGDIDIVEWHNLSKQVNRVSRGNLQGDDKHFVGVIKKQVDSLQKAKIKGPPETIKMWREANKLTLRKHQVKVLEKALDFADLDTGQYTQAEIASTIAKRFRQVYRSKDISMFDKSTQNIIRDIGKAKTHSAVVNLLRKLAPRGVVSAALGSGVLGSLFPGGMFIVPAIGEAAQRVANRSANVAARQLTDDVSRGIQGMVRPPQIAGPIGSMVSRIGAQQIPRQFSQPNN